MSFINPIRSQLNPSRKLIRLGVATTALFWLHWPAAWAQMAPPQAIAQSDGTEEQAEVSSLFVNPSSGNDQTGDGSENQPFKTITQALRQAKPNTEIVLAPGTYTPENGERFPLMLKPQVRIKGNPDKRGEGITIEGGGNYLSRSSASQNVAIVAANGTSLSGVTVRNPHARGYGLWIESTAIAVMQNTFTGNGHDGISIVGDATPTIRENHFVQNGANGMTIYGTARAEVRDNIVERTGFGINVGGEAQPLLIGNQITDNRDGVVIHGEAKPILRNNRIERNREHGVVAVGSSRPNLGTTAEPGGNVVRYNGELDINVSATGEIIPAFGNEVASDRTAGRLDLNGAIDPQLETTVARNEPPRPIPPPRPVPAPAPEPPSTSSFPAPSAIAPQSDPAPAAVSLPVPTPENAIEIPVPPPQNSAASTAPPPPTRQNSNPQIGNRPGDTLPSLLPVPDPNAPIGNGGSSVPDVGDTRTASTDGPPPPPSYAATLGLRYRVIVEASSSRERARVRRVVPDAFRTRINGRMVMQVGAFATQDKVDEMMERLERNGLRGIVLDIQ